MHDTNAPVHHQGVVSPPEEGVKHLPAGTFIVSPLPPKQCVKGDYAIPFAAMDGAFPDVIVERWEDGYVPTARCANEAVNEPGHCGRVHSPVQRRRFRWIKPLREFVRRADVHLPLAARTGACDPSSAGSSPESARY